MNLLTFGPRPTGLIHWILAERQFLSGSSSGAALPLSVLYSHGPFDSLSTRMEIPIWTLPAHIFEAIITTL